MELLTQHLSEDLENRWLSSISRQKRFTTIHIWGVRGPVWAQLPGVPPGNRPIRAAVLGPWRGVPTIFKQPVVGSIELDLSDFSSHFGSNSDFAPKILFDEAAHPTFARRSPKSLIIVDFPPKTIYYSTNSSKKNSANGWQSFFPSCFSSNYRSNSGFAPKK